MTQTLRCPEMLSTHEPPVRTLKCVIVASPLTPKTHLSPERRRAVVTSRSLLEGHRFAVRVEVVGPAEGSSLQHLRFDGSELTAETAKEALSLYDGVVLRLKSLA